MEGNQSRLASQGPQRRGDDKTRILILGKEKREEVVVNKDLTKFALPDGPLKNLALRAAFKEASSMLR